MGTKDWVFGAMLGPQACVRKGSFRACCQYYLMTPFCSGICPNCVAMPASTQVEPRRLAQRTLTKSRGPTRFPADSAASSWVITVSFPIFCRTYQATGNQNHCLASAGGKAPPLTALATFPTGLSWGPVTHTWAPHLDLLNIGVPLSHCLHAFHKLFIKPLHGLVHHHLQPENLAHIWDHFTQHFVSIGLSGSERSPRIKLEENIPTPENINNSRQGRKETGELLSSRKPGTISE